MTLPHWVPRWIVVEYSRSSFGDPSFCSSRKRCRASKSALWGFRGQLLSWKALLYQDMNASSSSGLLNFGSLEPLPVVPVDSGADIGGAVTAGFGCVAKGFGWTGDGTFGATVGAAGCTTSSGVKRLVTASFARFKKES